jgi:hypothetical protein
MVKISTPDFLDITRFRASKSALVSQYIEVSYGTYLRRSIDLFLSLFYLSIYLSKYLYNTIPTHISGGGRRRFKQKHAQHLEVEERAFMLAQ